MERLTGKESYCSFVCCDNEDKCKIENVCYDKKLYGKLKEFENLEEQLESIYGEHEGLLETAVKSLVKHEGVDFGKPYKARLLTDEDVDKWEEYKSLEEQPKVGEWIPCSERLPDRYCHCLVTRMNKYNDGFDIDVREDIFIELEGIWWWQSMFEGLTGNIVAWMPLPEPYKE